jgi:hypothetical protein
MKRREFIHTIPAAMLSAAAIANANVYKPSRTVVAIQGDRFFINGQPTYKGRSFQGMKIEGLLMNSRVVQGIYDDTNPETVQRWAYPDTGKWDAERNTREYIAAMPEWRKNGLLAITLNLQGGSPEGYSKAQPWINSTFNADGSMKEAYLQRLERILNQADQLGMVVILGYFYFGQDERLRDEAAVKNAVVSATQWLVKKGWRNLLIEVNNECNIKAYDHNILKPERVDELINVVRTTSKKRFLVGTSYGGGAIPTTNVIKASDYILLHGNGVKDPNRIAEMVAITRRDPAYRPMPIVFNEDDHFDFDQPVNNFIKAVGAYASWGYFDPGKSDYSDGYQSPPVNWDINSERKKAFFKLVKEMTGS